MPVPATSGILRTTLASMNLGDYIVCNYQAPSGAVGTFSNLGGTAGAEISLTGDPVPNGTFYFIKADTGLLIADRVVQNSISWDTLNAGKLIQGNPQAFKVIPNMTSNTTPAPYVISSSSVFSASYLPWKSFDGANQWISQNPPVANEWIQVDLGSVSVLPVISYNFANKGASDSSYVSAWNLLGSNTGSFSGEETVLDSRTGIAAGTTPLNYKIANPQSFRYFRWKLTAGYTYYGLGQISLNYGLIRSLTGGVSFADANGYSTTTDAGKGAWTPNNEWDKYIVNSTLNSTITAGNDNTWHWSAAVKSWTQDTPILAIGASTLRVTRGQTAVASFSSIASSTATTSYGIRPVLEYS
jgi:hypothetical protein